MEKENSVTAQRNTIKNNSDFDISFRVLKPDGRTAVTIYFEPFEEKAVLYVKDPAHPMPTQLQIVSEAVPC